MAVSLWISHVVVCLCCGAEMVCEFESAMAAQQRLIDAGISQLTGIHGLEQSIQYILEHVRRLRNPFCDARVLPTTDDGWMDGRMYTGG